MLVQVHVWKDALQHKQKAAYVHHTLNGKVSSAGFCPYEDVLAVGHSAGLSTMLVPGAGEPNFDSLVANPYQTAKARREQEVHLLLDKLPADMIVLDPSNVAKVQYLESVAQCLRIPFVCPFLSLAGGCILTLHMGRPSAQHAMSSSGGQQVTHHPSTVLPFACHGGCHCDTSGILSSHCLWYAILDIRGSISGDKAAQ
jgi:hypothetical protein